jgi:hypothetical protein
MKNTFRLGALIAAVAVTLVVAVRMVVFEPIGFEQSAAVVEVAHQGILPTLVKSVEEAVFIVAATETNKLLSFAGSALIATMIYFALTWRSRYRQDIKSDYFKASGDLDRRNKTASAYEVPV